MPLRFEAERRVAMLKKQLDHLDDAPAEDDGEATRVMVMVLRQHLSKQTNPPAVHPVAPLYVVWPTGWNRNDRFGLQQRQRLPRESPNAPTRAPHSRSTRLMTLK